MHLSRCTNSHKFVIANFDVFYRSEAITYTTPSLIPILRFFAPLGITGFKLFYSALTNFHLLKTFAKPKIVILSPPIRQGGGVGVVRNISKSVLLPVLRFFSRRGGIRMTNFGVMQSLLLKYFCSQLENK